MMLSVRPGLETLQPYTVDDIQWEIKLDANECGDDLPPAVKAKVMEKLAVAPFNRYPEITMKRLRTMIGESLGYGMDNVLIGNGSNGLLTAICQVFGGAGRSIVFSRPSFSMYGIYAKMADSPAVPVDLEPGFRFCSGNYLATAADAKAALMIICNPNNPTGRPIPLKEVEKVLVKATCPVVLDEAYYEFYGQSAVGLVKKYPQLIVARTFSKAYSLAAARVGYVITSPEMAAVIGKVLLPYSVNNLSLLTAEAVFEARAEFVPGIERTKQERERMAAALAAVPGVTVFTSATNFILFHLSDSNALTKELEAKNIGVRNFGGAPGLENCIRVSVGTPAENDAFLKVVTGR